MNNRHARTGLSRSGTGVFCLLLAALVVGSGCSSKHYWQVADKEAYRIVGDKQVKVFGQKTDFSIATPYTGRNPQAIPPEEIFLDRDQDGHKFLTLADAVRIGVGNSPTYQFQREELFREALQLSDFRHRFNPRFGATVVGTEDRLVNGQRREQLVSKVSVSQFLKTGGSLGVAIANDLLRFYTGSGSGTRTATSILSVNVMQPLLRNSGPYNLAVEALTQAERDVVYAVRTFSRFQTTFAVDSIVTPYLRLLLSKDTVRNEYNGYKNAIAARELSEALGLDRLARVQVDQARQRELDSLNKYLLAVESFRDLRDNYKLTLGLPLGIELKLDEKTIDDFRAMGLASIDIKEHEGFALAVKLRYDLLNRIDRFEDAARKTKVVANQLEAELNIFGDVSVVSEGKVDYTKFNWDKYTGGVGVELKLPLDRVIERNAYRGSFIDFERRLRELATDLDKVRDSVRQGLRGLELARESYEVQRRSVELARQRVESSEMLFQAGRVQIRDLLDAQDAQVRAQNAFSLAAVGYHITRLGLLRDIGIINVDDEKFWVKSYPLPTAVLEPTPKQMAQPGNPVITPELLFGNE